MKIKLLSFLFLFSFVAFSQGALTPVASFGSNPGNLSMYTYVPAGIVGTAPVVMVLHGCTQTAQQAADQTGWNKLADANKFYVVYPEQKTANNSSNCFNWFLTADQEKDQGEDLSLKQMIDYMKANYVIDTTQIFATGLSAGAAMTNVLCATYPEIFNAGAVLSGGPYKSATNAFEASNAMQGFVTNTPSDWANLVFAQNPGYTGSYPRIAIIHGTADPVVNITNATETMKQWTAVHNVDQTADATYYSYAYSGTVTYNSYRDNNGNEFVCSFIVSGLGHAVPLDTGICPQQGGQTATYAKDVYFHSTWHIADFFGLIDSTANTLYIVGSTAISSNQQGVTYTCYPLNSNYYSWAVPAGTTIINGQGTNSITVNFGTTGGLILVSQFELDGCLNGPAKIWVNTCTCSSIDEVEDAAFHAYYDQWSNLLIMENKNNFESIHIYNSVGQLIFSDKINNGANTIELPQGLSAGVYIIKASGSKTTSSKKIVIN